MLIQLLLEKVNVTKYALMFLFWGLKMDSFNEFYDFILLYFIVRCLQMFSEKCDLKKTTKNKKKTHSTERWFYSSNSLLKRIVKWIFIDFDLQALCYYSQRLQCRWGVSNNFYNGLRKGSEKNQHLTAPRLSNMDKVGWRKGTQTS